MKKAPNQISVAVMKRLRRASSCFERNAGRAGCSGTSRRGGCRSLGIDVYEDEAGLFYEDQSDRLLTDGVFSRLLTFPNVLITGHQAFFTREALTTIAETTLESISDFGASQACRFVVPEAP